MAKITVITGGTMSGKSRWAVSYFSFCDNVCYLCTAPEIDKGAAKRIAYNEDSRNVMWKIERNFIPKGTFAPSYCKHFIFDSISDYIYHKLCREEKIPDDPSQYAEQIINNLTKFMDAVKALDGNLIIITNETGFCPEPTEAAQDVYIRILSAVNQRIANLADEVYLSVSGIQLRLK